MGGALRSRGAKAYEEFQRRARHARYRVYALGTYGLIVAATLAAQLYTQNPLGAYVRVEELEVPRITNIFLRNDSSKPWNNLKLTLNGIYGYEKPRLGPGDFVLLRVDRFALLEANTGKLKFAPANITARHLALDCDRGHWEKELP